MVLEIKIDGKRIAGGLYELEEIRATSAWAGHGFGFYDLDPHGRLTPTALESFDGDTVSRMVASICVVRKSDKKCLHLLTDVGVADIDIDSVIFDSYGQDGGSSFNNVDGDYDDEDNATHDFKLYGAV